MNLLETMIALFLFALTGTSMAQAWSTATAVSVHSETARVLADIADSESEKWFAGVPRDVLVPSEDGTCTVTDKELAGLGMREIEVSTGSGSEYVDVVETP